MITEWLNRLQSDAAKICRPHVDIEDKLGPGKEIVLVNFGEGWCYGVISEKAPSEVRFALEVFCCLKTLEIHLDEQGNLSGDLDWVFMQAMKIGQLAQHINAVLPIKDDAERGRKVWEAASSGGKNNAGHHLREQKKAATSNP